MTEDRDCIIHAAQLQEAVDAARLLVDKLSAVPPRRSIRSLLHQNDDHHMTVQAIYDLEDTMKSLLRNVNELRNRLLSPSTRLHDELLQEIFLYCSNSMVRRHPHQHAWKQFDPVILTSVCRRWRTVALNTAAVWANLNIEPSSGVYDPSENPWRVLSGDGDVDFHIHRDDRYRVFLERSKQAGLGLNLNLLNLPISNSHQLLTDEVRQLGTKCGGIDRLYLQTLTSRDEIALESLKLVQQTVRYLKIMRGSTGRSPAAETHAMNGDSIFSNEWPRLQSLSLHAIGIPSRPPLPYVPLRHLRKLDLFVYPTTTDAGILNVLQLCNKTLEELVIQCSWSVEGSSVPQMTRFPRLQRLKLNGYRHNLTVLLQHIWAPSLTKLELHPYAIQTDGQQPDSTPFLAKLSKFVQESQCRLEVVSLTEIPRSAWKEIVESTAAPTICSVLYGGSRVDDLVLHQGLLDLLKTDLHRLANLEELISTEPQSSLQLQNMLEFVQSRHPLHNRGAPVKPIRRVSIQGRQAEAAEERRECVRIQKELTELIEHLIVGQVRFDKPSKQWIVFEGGGDWHYKLDIPGMYE
ncbi:hypothetical protein CALVIDRAFT_540775 [Calocera viscosa TUFC12733]|uniref:F-box domain-containing protein n=1 Tax=Calocera viscosa (strain TUFC12733) TaxID=1330018 RepID=A0A167IJ14_CALVF|nr:hypothetical protein CALVIDRAFT_540775 [Calocera viscosa TUFC12733]